MKRSTIIIMVMTSLIWMTGSKASSDPSRWSDRKLDKWYSKKEWLNGWEVNPDASINKRALAVSYFKNTERWEKAFTFIKNSDLSKLAAGRYDIDGDNLYASVMEYTTKNEDAADFEAHRKYIDIQYMISGKEIMNIAPLETVTEVLIPYDPAKDIEFMRVKAITGYKADSTNFFLFFPGDAHRPGMKDGDNAAIRKIVIKVKID
jgi:YhcH/YjgK/YiaL family protein